jgi:hypothetical protein
MPAWLCGAALAYFAFYPFISIFSIVVSKDTLHGGAACLFFIALMEASSNPSSFFKLKLSKNRGQERFNIGMKKLGS